MIILHVEVYDNPFKYQVYDNPLLLSSKCGFMMILYAMILLIKDNAFISAAPLCSILIKPQGNGMILGWPALHDAKISCPILSVICHGI